MIMVLAGLSHAEQLTAGSFKINIIQSGGGAKLNNTYSINVYNDVVSGVVNTSNQSICLGSYCWSRVSSCGNSLCEDNETKASCPQDCGSRSSMGSQGSGGTNFKPTNRTFYNLTIDTSLVHYSGGDIIQLNITIINDGFQPNGSSILSYYLLVIKYVLNARNVSLLPNL